MATLVGLLGAGDAVAVLDYLRLNLQTAKAWKSQSKEKPDDHPQ
jgi:hypothetical protein